MNKKEEQWLIWKEIVLADIYQYLSKLSQCQYLFIYFCNERAWNEKDREQELIFPFLYNVALNG